MPSSEAAVEAAAAGVVSAAAEFMCQAKLVNASRNSKWLNRIVFCKVRVSLIIFEFDAALRSKGGDARLLKYTPRGQAQPRLSACHLETGFARLFRGRPFRLMQEST
jgi:hypothetical protein